MESQSSNAPAVARNEKSTAGPLANPLTMSVASHLVLQSFNALQGISVANTGDVINHPGTGSASNLHASPKNSPSSTPARIPTPKNSPTTTPARTSTPPRPKISHRVEETFGYGKDPFEHYGIAQGVILRAENVRRGSLESASRSVSN